MQKNYNTLSNRPHLAVLTTDGFQDMEAIVPIGYLVNKGADITVIGPKKGRVKAYNNNFELIIENEVGEVSIDEFDALLIPGGKAPAALKEDESSVNFARDFFMTGKPVAAICHGPQVLAAAGVLLGVTITGVSKIKSELENAGAIYKDEELVIDDNLITSRVPEDLPVFVKSIEEALITTPVD